MQSDLKAARRYFDALAARTVTHKLRHATGTSRGPPPHSHICSAILIFHPFSPTEMLDEGCKSHKRAANCSVFSVFHSGFLRCIGSHSETVASALVAKKWTANRIIETPSHVQLIVRLYVVLEKSDQ